MTRLVEVFPPLSRLVKTKPGSVEAEVMSGAEVNVTIFDWAVVLAEVETLQVAVFEESVE
jgi:hypothetical protein